MSGKDSTKIESKGFKIVLLQRHTISCISFIPVACERLRKEYLPTGFITVKISYGGRGPIMTTNDFLNVERLSYFGEAIGWFHAVINQMKSPSFFFESGFSLCPSSR